MKSFVWAFVLLIWLYAGYSVFRITQNTAPDFSVFYGVAQNARTGRAIYGDPHLFTGYGYPPYAILPYLPLAILPFGVSQAIFVAGSLAALVASVFVSYTLFAPKRPLQEKIIAASVAFLAFPSRFTLGMGQSNLIVLLLLLTSLVYRSGFLLGVAWIIKPQLMILLPLLLWKRQWRTLLVAALTLGLAVVVAGIMFGWHWYGYYISHELPILMEFRGREIYYNQGIEAFASRMGIPSLSLTLKIIALGVAALVIRKKSYIDAVPMVLSLLLLVMPLSWQHHYVLLLPAFIYVWYRLRQHRLVLIISLFLIGANIKDPSLSISPLVLSHVFIGNAMVFGLLSGLHRRP